MTTGTKTTTSKAKDSTGRGPRSPMPRWKIALLIGAALLTVGGLLLSAFSEPSPPAAAPSPSSAAGEGGEGALGAHLLPTTTPPATTPQPAPQPDVGSGLTTMGFSFFIGFAIGILLRTFLRLVLVFVGLMALVLLALDQADLVTVHWQQLDAWWSTFGDRISADFEHLRTALTGRLPQAGLAALGLFAGFRKG